MVDHADLVLRRNLGILISIKAGVPMYAQEIQIQRYATPIVFVDQCSGHHGFGLNFFDQLTVAKRASDHVGKFNR